MKRLLLLLCLSCICCSYDVSKRQMIKSQEAFEIKHNITNKVCVDHSY